MGSGYEISVQDVLRVAGQLDGLLVDFTGSVQDLHGVPIPVASYGQVGTTAARVTGRTNDQLGLAFTALANSIKELSGRVKTSAGNYAAQDRQLADDLARMKEAMKPVPKNKPKH